MSIPCAPSPKGLKIAGKPVSFIPSGIPENWPSFETCPQLGLMRVACVTYPWERDDYDFDFESVYPPIPDDSPEWVKQIVELTKQNEAPAELDELDEKTEHCPICPLFSNPIVEGDKIVGYKAERYKIEDFSNKIEDHPVWKMDPFPCRWHIVRDHLFYDRPSPCLIKPEDLEMSKRYIRQLRRSRGYDIDCCPHPSLVIPSLFVGEEYLVDRMRTKLQKPSGVIDLITRKTGKPYKLAEVHKVVWGYFIFLVTFSALDVGEGFEETFLATLKGEAILECLRRPQVDAPMPDISETIIQPAVITLI